MCLINFAFQANSVFPFILIGNRDEFYNRPTQQAHWWENNGNHILAGKDLRDGGTWMGINKKGCFAALTNYRDLQNLKKDAPSRGNIVKQILTEEIKPGEVSKYLLSEGKLFNGFNIVYGNRKRLYFYSNFNEKIIDIQPGIYGLSNALLNTPWPKVEKSSKQFTRVIENNGNDEEMFTIMQNKNRWPINMLPKTGVSSDWEIKLSAMFISTTTYGTRCTTLVKIDSLDNVLYHEKSYVPKGEVKFESKTRDQ